MWMNQTEYQFHLIEPPALWFKFKPVIEISICHMNRVLLKKKQVTFLWSFEVKFAHMKTSCIFIGAVSSAPI